MSQLQRQPIAATQLHRLRRWLPSAFWLGVAALVLPARAVIIVQNITWNGGTGSINDPNWLRTLDVVPGGIFSFDFGNWFIDGAKVGASLVNVNANASLHDLTISTGDTLNIVNGNTLTLLDTSGVGTVDNSGAITMNGSSLATTLLLSGGTFTATGVGNFTLSNSANNKIIGTNATDRLVNAAGHTIQGSGQIGVNSMALTNAGTIKANQSVSLIIDPSSSNAINSGTFLATNGATLALQNGTFTNTGGLIQADNNSHIDLTAATITGGTLTSVGAGHFHSLGLSNVLSGVTITSGTNIEIADNDRLTLAGTIANSGTLKLLSAGNATKILIDSAGATLSGSGLITTTNSTSNQIVGATTTTTLVNNGNTIRGSGQLGANSLQFDNRPGGIVEANQSQSLTIDPSGTGVINSGTLRAVSGALLKLQGGTFTNFTNAGSLVNGTIEAQTGSFVDVDTATIDGGLLATAGTGRIRLAGSVTLTNPTITTGSTVQVNDNTSTTLTGTVTNNGTLVLNSAGNATSLLIDSGGVTLTGGGVVTTSNSTANGIKNASGTPTLINVNNTIRGSGLLGANGLQFENQPAGIVEANQSQALTIDPAGTGVVNSGTLRAVSGATLELQNGTFTNFTNSGSLVNGLIEAQNASLVDLSGVTISGGLLGTSGTGLIRTMGASLLQNPTLTTGSALRLIDNHSTTLSGTFTNNGTLTLQSAGNATTLIIDSGGATLSGTGGVITLSNSTANLIKGATASTTLVNLNNTIRGSGQLGVNSLQFDNRPSGIVEASQSQPMILDPSGSGFVNSGTLRAVSGATLLLQGGTFTNFTNSGSLVNGSIQAQDQSLVDLTGATVDGGLLSTSGSGLIRGTGSVTLSNVNLTGNSLYRVNDNTATTLLGTMTNQGTIALNSAGNATSLTLDSAGVTLDGGGAVTMTNSTANLITASVADTLLINLNNTIGGSGQVGVDKLQIDNRAAGIIEARTSQPLIVDPSVAGLTNAGTLRAVSGATLALQNGTFTNTGAGQITVAAGSVVQASNATIVGGELVGTGSGRFRTIGAATLSGINLAVGSVWHAPDNTTTTLVGTINNLGRFEVASAGNATSIALDAGDVTLDGSGAFTLSNSTANIFVGAATTTTLVNLNNTIGGSGQIGTNKLQLDNRADGVIEATQSQPLIIDPSGRGVTNTGTLRAAGGTLRLQDGIFTNTGGQIAATTAGSLVEFNGATITGGTLSSVAGATLQNTAGSIFADLALAAGSLLEIPDNRTGTLRGLIDNEALVKLNSAGNATELIVDTGGVTLTGGGEISMSNTTANHIAGSGTLDNVDNTISGAGQVGLNQVTLINRSKGKIVASQTQPLILDLAGTSFTNQGTLKATGTGGLHLTDTAFINEGQVAIETGSHFTAAGSFTQSGLGGTSLTGGTLTAASFAFQYGGVLAGTGTVTGAVINDGEISPGGTAAVAGIGQLTFTNDLTLNSNSVVHIELGGVTTFDKIQAPAMTLAGNLQITFANNFETTVTLGNSFVVLSTTNATGLSGTFAGITNGSFHPTADGLGFFQVNYGLNNVTLSNFTAVPEPSTYALFGLGLAALAALRRRKS